MREDGRQVKGRRQTSPSFCNHFGCATHFPCLFLSPLLHHSIINLNLTIMILSRHWNLRGSNAFPTLHSSTNAPFIFGHVILVSKSTGTVVECLRCCHDLMRSFYLSCRDHLNHSTPGSAPGFIPAQYRSSAMSARTWYALTRTCRCCCNKHGTINKYRLRVRRDAFQIVGHGPRKHTVKSTKCGFSYSGPKTAGSWAQHLQSVLLMKLTFFAQNFWKGTDQIVANWSTIQTYYKRRHWIANKTY